jgi:hypothetical protein
MLEGLCWQVGAIETRLLSILMDQLNELKSWRALFNSPGVRVISESALGCGDVLQVPRTLTLKGQQVAIIDALIEQRLSLLDQLLDVSRPVSDCIRVGGGSR